MRLIGTKFRSPCDRCSYIYNHHAVVPPARQASMTIPLPLFYPALILSLVPLLIVLVQFLTWFIDPHGLRSFPGPWLARFSDLWLGRVAQQGHRSEVVHKMHKKYGEPAESCRLRGI
jgi:hypothetical protein